MITVAILKEIDRMHNQGASKRSIYQMKIDGKEFHQNWNLVELESIIKEKDEKNEELRFELSKMVPKELLEQRNHEIKVLADKV